MHEVFPELLEKYLSGSSTSGENQRLFGMIRSGSYDSELAGLIDRDARLKSFLSAHDPVIGVRSFAKIQEAIASRQRGQELPDPSRGRVRALFFGSRSLTRTIKLRWAGVAAAAVIALGTGAWIWMSDTQKESSVIVAHRPASASIDIPPGTDKAILTLSSGRKVVLSAGSEVLNDDGVVIRKTDGALSYEKSSILAYNTMTTPRGGQYRVTLPDGTKVWLNAASSVTYPTSFTGPERRVTVTGETYFEVAEDRSRPFIVKYSGPSGAGGEIAVLGTHFNVNAYADEPVSTITLLEGLVSVNHDLLRPGQAYSDGRISAANTEQAVAWKNGVFNFHRLPLVNVMRQLARWYDISVEYPQSVPGITLGGKMGRDLSLSQVLEVLSEMQVHYKMEDKKLLVLP